MPADTELARHILRPVQPDSDRPMDSPHSLDQNPGTEFNDVRARSMVAQDDPFHSVADGLNNSLVQTGLGEPVRDEKQPGTLTTGIHTMGSQITTGQRAPAWARKPVQRSDVGYGRPSRRIAPP